MASWERSAKCAQRTFHAKIRDVKEMAQDRLITVPVAYAALGGGSLPVWIAKEAGIFERNGIDAEVRLIRGSVQVARALLDGEVLFANIAAPAVVEANLRGGDLVVLTGGLNWLVQMLITRPEIRAPVDLRGRTLGVGAPGDIEDRLLRYILGLHQLRLGEDVAAQRVASQPEAIARMEAREIDGALFSPPYAFEATKRGYAILIDLGAQRLDYQLGGIMARRALVESNRDLTRRFVRAYVEAIHHYKEHPSFVVGVLRKYSLIEDEQVARQCYATLDKYFQPAPYPSLRGIQTILDHLAEQNPAAKSVGPETMVDPRWVRELEESGFIRGLYEERNP